MGAAKRRGTFEQRKSEAVKQNQNKPLQKSKPIKSSSTLRLWLHRLYGLWYRKYKEK